MAQETHNQLMWYHSSTHVNYIRILEFEIKVYDCVSNTDVLVCFCKTVVVVVESARTWYRWRATIMVDLTK